MTRRGGRSRGLILCTGDEHTTSIMTSGSVAARRRSEAPQRRQRRGLSVAHKSFGAETRAAAGASGGVCVLSVSFRSHLYVLMIGARWWTLGIILALSYFVDLYRSFRGKIQLTTEEQGY